jgi:hypothetical protein
MRIPEEGHADSSDRKLSFSQALNLGYEAHLKN